MNLLGIAKPCLSEKRALQSAFSMQIGNKQPEKRSAGSSTSERSENIKSREICAIPEVSRL